MAQFNENITLAAPNPLDKRYLSNRTSGGSQLPYSGVTEVYSIIPLTVRYEGLTVLISSGGTNTEYWFKDGVADVNLIQKKYNSETPIGDFVTGGTNVGYFSGFTGIQTLPIDNMVDNTFDGNYSSLYNYYFRGMDKKIHIGVPSDGILKRAYVKTTGQVKSWIWNEKNDYPQGWILVTGNVANQVGTIEVTGVPYYTGLPNSLPYTQTSWISGIPVLPIQGWVVINTVFGNLEAGTTYTNGSPVYAGEVNGDLEFRTIISKTPEIIKITNDEAIIYVSGKTPTVIGNNIGVGIGIYKDTTVGSTGTTINLRRIIGASSTSVTQSGDTIIIASTTPSGGTGGVYDLTSPAAITVGGICAGTVLAGKTSFELFEELLVPTLVPTLTAPTTSISLNPSGVFEVGCCIPALCITGTYNAGCINPQYSSASDKRSKGVTLYCFEGFGVGGACGSTTTSYTTCSINYIVCNGAQTGTVHNNYCCGVQPKDSKGNNYCTPLIPGSTLDACASISGIYPYFYGKLASSGYPVITNNLVTGGTKVVADSNGTVTVTFNSRPDEYTWLAIPATAISKHCWYVSIMDSGLMNQSPVDATNKYPNEFLLTGTTSGQGCWVSIPYKVYMSKTIGAITSPLEFRNS